MEPDNGTAGPATLAAELYMTTRHLFMFSEVAGRLELDEMVLRSHYQTKTDLLRGYYTEAWERYIQMELSVPEFTQYSLAEKLTTLVLSLCDEFDHVHGFALETYGILIHRNGTDSRLARLIRDRVHYYIATDENVSVLVKYVPGDLATVILTWSLFYLINERVYDVSIDKERTSALADKMTTLIQSVLYTGTLDHLIDLARYLGITYYSKK